MNIVAPAQARSALAFALLAAFALAPGRGLADDESLWDQFLNLFRGDRERERPAAGAVAYKVEFAVGGADRELASAVRAASNLRALSNAPPATAAGLVRRASADEERITAALYANGYYGGTIGISVAGVPVASAGAVAAIGQAQRGGPVAVKVTIEPGPRFRFGRIAFTDASGRQSVAPPAALATLGIEPGEPARATRIVAAEPLLVDALRRAGHPFAAVRSREVVADHARKTVDVTFRLDPGPKATFGSIEVRGTQALEPGFIRSRIPIRPGDPYTPERIAAFRKDMARYDVLDSLRIIEADRLDAEGRLPIIVDVRERLRHFVGFGAKYSSTDGASVNVYWGHRNLFGGAERLRLEATMTTFGSDPSDFADVDNLGYRVAAVFTKPGIFTVADDLIVQPVALRERTDAYDREGVLFALGVRRRINERLSIQIGLDLEFSNVRDVFGENDYRLFGFPVELAYDTTDSPLDPTRGVRISVIAAPFPPIANATVGMVVFKGTASTYLALDRRARWVLAGRVSAGSIVGAGVRDLPANRRFYAGGGGSIRGFNYQSVSPRDPAGTIVGGLSLVEGSVELRVKITDTIGVVAFVDAGAAFESRFPDFSDAVRFAAGIGARYYTGIGPIRFDVAVPLDRREGDASFGIYVSVGQAF